MQNNRGLSTLYAQLTFSFQVVSVRYELLNLVMPHSDCKEYADESPYSSITTKLSYICLRILPLKYTVNPGYKRTLILMAAKHEFGLTGICNYWSNEPAFLYHKTEVIRLLKEQIGLNPQNPEE